MNIKEIGLCWVSVKDHTRTKKFLTSLGLNLVEDHPENGWMEFQGNDKGTRLGIAQSSPQADQELAPGNNAIVTFSVDNIENCKIELENSEATILGEIIEIPNIVKMLMFTDPDGNRFQLAEILDDK